MPNDLFEEKKSQTAIKHNILESYIRPWAIIISKHFPQAFYVDAFAGAGKYKSGEDGSPVIASRILLAEQKNRCKFNVICIEKDKEHVDKLKACQKEFQNKISFEIQEGEFIKKIDNILKRIGNSPAFFLIDPAGFAGMDFVKIQSILELQHKEILINFMYNAIQRWKSIPSLKKTITALFGTDKWESKDGEWELLKLYIEQLRKTKSFVWPFKNKFPDKDRTLYYLIYATKNLTGFKIMKEIMFKTNTRKYFEPNLFAEIEFDSYIKTLQALVVKYKEVSHSTLLAYTLQETQYLENDLKKAIIKLKQNSKIESKNDLKYPVYKAGCKANNPINFETIDGAYLETLPVEYQTVPKVINSGIGKIERKTLLYKTKVEYSNWTINHITGCKHGCKFPCYAMMMAKKFGWVKDYEDWRTPRIATNALELLEKEIPKYKPDIDFVHLCFMSDPFMYDSEKKQLVPEVKELTLKIIERLNREGIKVTTLTKGIYPVEVLDKKRFLQDNEYGITLVSLNDNFKSKFEQFSAPYKERVGSLKKLAHAGLNTWASMEPYPTPELDETAGNIENILENISFVKKIIFGKLNYNKLTNYNGNSTSMWKNNEEFYRETVQKVINFCKKNNIKYHIKSGTPLSKYNTKDIFRKKEV